MDQPKQWRSELQSPDAARRVAAAEHLSHASDATAAVELVRACGDEPEVREWAVAALEDLGPPPAELQAELRGLVSSGDPLVAYWAATLLGRLGPAASNSQQELTKALSTSRDAALRQRAAWALGEIEARTSDAVAALQRATRTGDARLARVAKRSLEAIKEE